MIRIQLHAFDKQTSANYGKTIGVKHLKELKAEVAIFDKEVPFSRYYTEHEILKVNGRFPKGEPRKAWEKFLEEN